MTAIPHGARVTLAKTFSNNTPAIKTVMSDTMQRLLSECDTNKKRVALWNRNPMTGKTLAGKYNDRSGREIHHA